MLMFIFMLNDIKMDMNGHRNGHGCQHGHENWDIQRLGCQVSFKKFNLLSTIMWDSDINIRLSPIPIVTDIGLSANLW
jgi:hypothetical protein